MPELELKIAQWRERMRATMSIRPEAVRELEEHLREHIDLCCAQGVSSDEAFDRGVKRLGDAQEISREFGRMDSRRGATARILLATHSLLIALVGALGVWIAGRHLDHKWELLREVHGFLLSAGCLTIFGSGLIGTWVVWIKRQRPWFDGEHQALHRAMIRLVKVGAVLVPIGIGLGMAWAAKIRGHAWSWAPTEVGALTVLVSMWLLLAVQQRMIAAPAVRWMLAMVGCVVLGQTTLWTKIATLVGAIFWLGCAFIAVHGAMVLLEASKKAEQVND